MLHAAILLSGALTYKMIKVKQLLLLYPVLLKKSIGIVFNIFSSNIKPFP